MIRKTPHIVCVPLNYTLGTLSGAPAPQETVAKIIITLLDGPIYTHLAQERIIDPSATILDVGYRYLLIREVQRSVGTEYVLLPAYIIELFANLVPRVFPTAYYGGQTLNFFRYVLVHCQQPAGTGPNLPKIEGTTLADFPLVAESSVAE